MYSDRQAHIRHLEEVRGSRTVCYVMSDREVFPAGTPGFSAGLAADSQWQLISLLRQCGHVPQLDLFLYTRGGDVDSVWRYVKLLRQYADRFTVIVPFRAHSAGTLLCLGADEIVMSDWAELSPVDPSTANAFNPRDQQKPGAPLPIGVEDVAAYFKMAEDLGKLQSEQSRAEVFKQLSSTVQPLALGNVQRIYSQIRSIASKLLALHVDHDGRRIEEITRVLVEDFYSHGHAITRGEAQEILGSWVREPSHDEEAAIVALFDAYSNDLSLSTKFSMVELMGDEPAKQVEADAALLESTDSSYAFRTTMNVLQRPQFPAGVQVQVPPGQAMPLSPWVQRAYDFGIQKAAWVHNAEGR